MNDTIQSMSVLASSSYIRVLMELGIFLDVLAFLVQEWHARGQRLPQRHDGAQPSVSRPRGRDQFGYVARRRMA